MKKDDLFFNTLAALGKSIAVVLFMAGCSQINFLYLKTETQNRVLHKQKGGIEVTLEVSKTSLVNNRLIIRNKSSSPLTVSAENISLEIPGKSLKATAVADYMSFLDMRSSQLQSLCDRGESRNVCTDEIRSFYLSLKNTGFIFGTIRPQESSRGNIAFNIPLIVDKSTWDGDKGIAKRTKPYKAKVHFFFVVNQKPLSITFPLLLACEDIDNLPYPLLKYLN